MIYLDFIVFISVITRIVFFVGGIVLLWLISIYIAKYMIRSCDLYELIIRAYKKNGIKNYNKFKIFCRIFFKYGHKLAMLDENSKIIHKYFVFGPIERYVIKAEE